MKTIYVEIIHVIMIYISNMEMFSMFLFLKPKTAYNGFCTENIYVYPPYPDSVTAIHEDAFCSSENVMIYCNTDSYAHEFSEAKGISYILLDSPNTVRFLLGDADNDGIVTISDVTLIQRVLAELEQDDDGMIELRVTNGEEKLNIFNATEIQRYLARLPIERTIDIPIIKSLT